MAAGALLREGLDRAVPLWDRQPGSLQDVVRPGLVRAQPDADDAAPLQLLHDPLALPAPEGGPLLGDRPERGVDVAADRVVVVALLQPQLQPLVELPHREARVDQSLPLVEDDQRLLLR